MRGMKDYFRGGNTIPWWLSGISYWMTSFSAFAFVYYSSLSYKYGLFGVMLLLGHGAGHAGQPALLRRAMAAGPHRQPRRIRRDPLQPASTPVVRVAGHPGQDHRRRPEDRGHRQVHLGRAAHGHDPGDGLVVADHARLHVHGRAVGGDHHRLRPVRRDDGGRARSCSRWCSPSRAGWSSSSGNVPAERLQAHQRQIRVVLHRRPDPDVLPVVQRELVAHQTGSTACPPRRTPASAAGSS